MRFRLVAVGKPREVGIASVIAEYERRASRYWPLEVVEVREGGSASRDAVEVMKREGEQLLARAGAGVVVACDEGGESFGSVQFAGMMQRWREEARDVAFVLGGAHGLSQAVRQRADRRLAVAPWTLPHDLARLVLAEQLYRAGTIQRGEPYHKS